MIINYHDRDTRYVFERVRVARLSMELQRQAQRKLSGDRSGHPATATAYALTTNGAFASGGRMATPAR